MDLIECPKCKKSISETVEKCPHCGYCLTPEKILELKTKQNKDAFRGFLAILVIAAIIIGIIGTCSKDGKNNDKETFYKDEKKNGKKTLKGYVFDENRELIPFEIIKTGHWFPYKKVFDIRVSKIDGRYPTEEQLADISNHCKNQEQETERTFVTFFLPGMKLDAGAWASAHHNPNLEVEICGMTNELLKKFADISDTPEFKAWENCVKEYDRISEESNNKFGGFPSDHLNVGQKLRLEKSLPIFPFINGDDGYRAGYARSTGLPFNTEIEIVKRIEQGSVYYLIKLPNGLLAFCMAASIGSWYDTDERRGQLFHKMLEWEDAKSEEIKNEYFTSKGLDFNTINEKASDEEWFRFLSR